MSEKEWARFGSKRMPLFSPEWFGLAFILLLMPVNNPVSFHAFFHRAFNCKFFLSLLACSFCKTKKL
jgi:hypothetical protein